MTTKKRDVDNARCIFSISFSVVTVRKNLITSFRFRNVITVNFKKITMSGELKSRWSN